MKYSKGELVYLDTDGDTLHFLASPLEVEGFDCAIIELTGKINGGIKKDEPLFLCSDLCKDGFVGTIKLPVLRRIIRNSSGFIQPFLHVSWIRVMRPSITTIRLYITNIKGEIISLGNSKLTCTLLFV